MGSIAEIEQAVAELPNRDFAAFGRWFDELRNQRWDRQMDEDAASGALDFLIAELDYDLARGNVRPLDEVLHQS